jgi:hypothetical protein
MRPPSLGHQESDGVEPILAAQQVTIVEDLTRRGIKRSRDYRLSRNGPRLSGRERTGVTSSTSRRISRFAWCMWRPRGSTMTLSNG